MQEAIDQIDIEFAIAVSPMADYLIDALNVGMHLDYDAVAGAIGCLYEQREIWENRYRALGVPTNPPIESRAITR